MSHQTEEQTLSSLPRNFAQSVLQLEMQMEFEQLGTLDVVQQLNQLYRIAIEHYIGCQDQRKIHHFQRKLQMLLTHPRTLQAIENKSEPPKDRQAKKAANYSHNLNFEINKFNAESNVLVKSMMEGSDIKMQRSNKLLNQNITSQEEKLKKRLQSRGKSRAKTDRVRA